MLPTTGYFKNFNCPFYASCICERTYCHYKHHKRETINSINVISELVSKVVDQVLGPTARASLDTEPKKIKYNPTPISELNKCKQQTVKDDLTEIKIPHTSIQQERPQFYQNTLENAVDKSGIEASKKQQFNCFSSSIKTLTETSDVKMDINSKSCTPLNFEIAPRKDLSSTKLSKHIDEFLNYPNLFESSVAAVSNKEDKMKEGHSILKRHFGDTSNSKSSNRAHHKRDKERTSKKSSTQTKKKDNTQTRKNSDKHKSHNKKERSDKQSPSNKFKADKNLMNECNKENNCDMVKKNNIVNNNQNKEKMHLSGDRSFLDSTFLSNYEPENTVLEQCKCIFEEYQPPIQEMLTKTEVEVTLDEDSSITSISRKRVAYPNSKNVREKLSRRTSAQNAATAMISRYKSAIPKVRQNKMTPINGQMKNNDIFSTPNLIKKTNLYVSSLLNTNKNTEELMTVKERNKTAVQTAANRIAHSPDVSLADTPSVLQVEKSKLPVNVRNRYLLLLIKECTKLYTNKQAVCDRALNEELNCYTKCSLLSSYRNSVMLSINRLRKENKIGQTANSTKSSALENSDEKFYANLSKWILSTEELYENGYPQPDASKKGYALFKDNKIYEQTPQNCQVCVRCKKTYNTLIPEDCVYHPAGRFTVRGESKYACCRSTSSADGCCVFVTHVFEVKSPSLLSGFVKTFEPEDPNDIRNMAVYALDCEMVYTTCGTELARVTVINHKYDVVYETMVKPFGDILDYNTRYSGITAKMLKNITTTLVDVQATLLSMFNWKTILIGHSLESDLKALRIIHSTVIDTSVLFPHKMGLPKKRSLKALASEYLKKIIQNNEAGHDSAEDAIASMELVNWKLKEKL